MLSIIIIHVPLPNQDFTLKQKLTSLGSVWLACEHGHISRENWWAQICLHSQAKALSILFKTRLTFLKKSLSVKSLNMKKNSLQGNILFNLEKKLLWPVIVSFVIIIRWHVA